MFANFDYTAAAWKKLFEQISQENMEMHREAGTFLTHKDRHYEAAYTVMTSLGIYTYDGDMDVKMAPKFILLLNELINGSTSNFWTSDDDPRYAFYLMAMHTPFLTEFTSWGTSIRGAFIDVEWGKTKLNVHLPVSWGEYDNKVFRNSDDMKARIQGLIDFYKEYAKPYVAPEQTSLEQPAA